MRMEMDWEEAEFLLDVGRKLTPEVPDVPAFGRFRVKYDVRRPACELDTMREARALAFALALLSGKRATVEREVSPGRWQMETEFSRAEAMDQALAGFGGVS